MTEGNPNSSEDRGIKDHREKVEGEFHGAVEESRDPRLALSPEENDVVGEEPRADYHRHGGQREVDEEEELVEGFDPGNQVAVEEIRTPGGTRGVDKRR